jgi:uncharacterized protein (TIGR00255 family)
MVQSMTGFAVAEGAAEAFSWRWEARSVNGRGLDLRLRLSDGAEALEPELRPRAAGALGRGSVAIALKVEGAAPTAGRLDPLALEAAVSAASAARAAAEAAGLAVAPVCPARLIALRGVMTDAAGRESGPPQAALLADFDAALAALVEARRCEGAEIARVLAATLDEIAALVDGASAAHEAQADAAPARLREKVAALTGAGAEVPPERLAAELALLAVRNDVSEEIDRLRAHVAAARRLLAGDGAVGRELDFLTQEFNREANTLCSKAASVALTETGLALKVRIDRLREQVQNIE